MKYKKKNTDEERNISSYPISLLTFLYKYPKRIFKMVVRL